MDNKNARENLERETSRSMGYSEVYTSAQGKQTKKGEKQQENTPYKYTFCVMHSFHKENTPTTDQPVSTFDSKSEYQSRSWSHVIST